MSRARRNTVKGMYALSAVILGIAVYKFYRKSQTKKRQVIEPPVPLLPPQNGEQVVQEPSRPPPLITAQELVPYITYWEGYRERPYKDSRGIWTVGVGFNLEARGDRLRFAPFKTTAEAVIQGRRQLTRREIELLLQEEITHSLNAAKRLVPNLSVHPRTIQAIVVDMVYNLGERGFRNFVNARAALREKNYQKFADEIEDSRWFSQVGRRSRHHVDTADAVAVAIAQGEPVPPVSVPA